jgi:hypothetical protein
MPLENAQYISELNKAWPLGSDGVNQSDDQHRVIKQAVQQSLPLLDGPVNCTPGDLNLIAGAATTGSKYGLNPTGTVIMGMFVTAPVGYLLCDGEVIDVQYTELIAIAGTNTPDMRGQGVRGTSPDNAVDPDGPRVPGTLQDDDYEQHNHSIAVGVNTNGTGQVRDSSPGGVTHLTGNAGGDETRMKNIAMTFIIKW